VARRVRSLAKRRATSRDPELVALAADVMDPPPINDAPYKMFKLLETPQSKEVDRLLGKMASSACIISAVRLDTIHYAAVLIVRITGLARPSICLSLRAG